MPGMPINCAGGDFVGKGTLDIGALWTGPKASKFNGFTFARPKTRYTASDVISLTELRQEQGKSFAGTAVAAGAGALLFGGIGLLAGALGGGNTSHTVVAVRFRDGKTVVFSIDSQDKAFMCLKLYSLENDLIRQP